MPAICDLEGVRRAVAGALRVSAGPVPADDLRTWMRLQPRLQGRGLTVRQQVHRVPGADVHQHRPVHVPLAQREIINPEDLRRGGDLRLRQCHDQAQHGRRVYGDAHVQASRAAALPASSRPNPASMPSSGTLRRRYRSVSPPACSANVTAGH